MDANFIGEVTDYLKCIVCHLVLKDPLLLVECGHRLCKECFNRIRDYAVEKNSPVLCPHDRIEVNPTQVVEDKGVTRAIFDLKVQCNSVNDGCFWSGELRDLQDHVEHRCNAVMIKRFMTDIEGKLKEKDKEIQALNTKFKDNVEQIKHLQAISEENRNEIGQLEQQLLQKDVELSLMKYNVSCIGKKYFTSKVPIPSTQCSAQDSVEEISVSGTAEDISMRESACGVKNSSVANLTVPRKDREPGELKRKYEELKMQCDHKDVEIAMLKYQLAHTANDDIGNISGYVKKLKSDLPDNENASDGNTEDDKKNACSLAKNNSLSEGSSLLGQCRPKCVHCDRIGALEKSSQNLFCAVMNVNKYSPDEVTFIWEITKYSYHKNLGDDLLSPKFYTTHGFCCYLLLQFKEKSEFLNIFIRVCKGIYNDTPTKPKSILAKFRCTDRLGNHHEKQMNIMKDVLLPVGAEYRPGDGPSGFLKMDTLKDFLIDDTLTVTVSLS